MVYIFIYITVQATDTSTTIYSIKNLYSFKTKILNFFKSIFRWRTSNRIDTSINSNSSSQTVTPSAVKPSISLTPPPSALTPPEPEAEQGG